ncbi:fungal-specific transcription factor domain-containing protein [Aspergillus aurantiobrunneus]
MAIKQELWIDHRYLPPTDSQSCYSDRPKPEWMDNGAKQREMVDQLKAEVKKNATRHRSRRLIQSAVRDLDEQEESETRVPEVDITLSQRAQGTNERNPDEDKYWTPRYSGDATSDFNAAHLVSGSPGFAQIPLDHSTRPNSHRLSQPLGIELEMGFVMIYLDYTFPVLFPFYTPSIFEGGRAWLLVLPMKIKALYHTVISLTSYFFSHVPARAGPIYGICIDLAVKLVQRRLHTINSQGVHCNLLESVYLLESIVQLLILDGVVATTENWRIHLDAAIVLFEQIVRLSGSVSSVLDFMSQLSLLPARTESDSFWTVDQAAFRFFSVILLVADVIPSTALEQPPKLHKYHHDLPMSAPGHGQKTSLQLEGFTGCQNWKHRSLTMTQLMKRASTIEHGLQTGFSCLTSINDTEPSSSTHRLSDLFPLNNSSTSHTTNIVTRIWAHAARIYLHTVLSGWQTAAPEIREDVSQTISLFNRLSSPGSLRALAWPFCVAGCLADEGQESAFREIISSMGPLGTLGTMQAALGIMENVWRKRVHIDPDTWDIAACLGASGHAVLFI